MFEVPKPECKPRTVLICTPPARLVGHVLVTPTLWQGTVTLPPAPVDAPRYRLVIAEYEEYLVDDATPYDPIPTKKDRRLVFIEYVELD